jgi:hypothetical protein
VLGGQPRDVVRARSHLEQRVVGWVVCPRDATEEWPALTALRLRHVSKAEALPCITFSIYEEGGVKLGAACGHCAGAGDVE